MITLNDVAASYHEMYLSCVKAGFSPLEAVYLVGQVWAASAVNARG